MINVDVANLVMAHYSQFGKRDS